MADEPQSYTAVTSEYAVICPTRFNVMKTSKPTAVSTNDLYISIYLSIVRLDPSDVERNNGDARYQCNSLSYSVTETKQ